MKNLVLGFVTAAVLLTGSLVTSEANAQYGRYYSYRPSYGYNSYYAPRTYSYRPYSYYPGSSYYYGSPRYSTGYRGYYNTYPRSYGYGYGYGYGYPYRGGGVYFNY